MCERKVLVCVERSNTVLPSTKPCLSTTAFSVSSKPHISHTDMVLYLVEPSLEFTQDCCYHEVQYDCGFGGLFIIYNSLSALVYFPGAVCGESCQVFPFPLSLFDSLLHLWTLCLTFCTVFCHVQWKHLFGFQLSGCFMKIWFVTESWNTWSPFRLECKW